MSGRFAITEILGAGAFALVCAATDRSSGAAVALKLLRPALRSDAGAVGRLRDEGRILNALHHEHLARCLETLDYGGHPVLVLERIRGANLDQVMGRGSLSIEASIGVGLALAKALQHGWEAPGPDGEPMRIVHRDLKPANVLLTPEGRVVLIDYGIAKGAFAGRRAKSLFLVQGSAGFDAPERREGGEDTERVDVYGLGALMLTLATGFAPVLPRQGDREALLQKHLARIEGGDQAVDLLRQMLSPHAVGRPSMQAVIDGLRALNPPAEALRHAIQPVPAADPRQDDRWSEVAFLEAVPPSAGATPLGVAQGERALRRMLGERDWPSRIPEIEALLERCSVPPVGPLVEILGRTEGHWYKPWSRVSDPEELAAALLLLCDRATPAAYSRARSLVDHPTPAVRAAARFLIGQEPRG